jgi:hypothetical protein
MLDKPVQTSFLYKSDIVLDFIVAVYLEQGLELPAQLLAFSAGEVIALLGAFSNTAKGIASSFAATRAFVAYEFDHLLETLVFEIHERNEFGDL